MQLLSLIDFFLPEAAQRDARRAQTTRVLIAVCLADVVLEPIMSLRHFVVTPNLRGGILTLAIGVLGVPLLAAIRRGLSPRIVTAIIASFATVGSVVVSLTRGGFYISTLLGTTIVPLCVGMVGGQRATLRWAAIVGVALAALAVVTRTGILGLKRDTAIDAAPLIAFFLAATGVSVIYEQTRKRLEREKEDLQHRIEQTERLEALGHLAAGVAHDFNNLLTVFRAAGEVMVEELPAGHALRADAEAVREAADRGATIARQLLAFSRPQAAEASAFDLVATVAGMEPLLRRALPEAIALHLATSSKSCRIHGDSRQLMNVMLNLVVNARDAMPGRGSVTISIDERVLPAVDGCPMAPGRYAVIVVKDDGAGIPDAVLPHIFDPFFTTKTRERGSGLGLATAYGVVRAMKGQIRVVETGPGLGSTFEILLPCLDEADAEAPGLPGSIRPAPPARPTVLVVDDQPELAAAVRRLLARDFEILTAAGGQEALDLFAKHDDIDVVLTDVSMPTIGGIELASRLRKLKPSIAIVYMTGYSDDEAISREVDAGTARLIRKPFERASLTKEIERAVHSKTG